MTAKQIDNSEFTKITLYSSNGSGRLTFEQKKRGRFPYRVQIKREREGLSSADDLYKNITGIVYNQTSLLRPTYK